MKESIEERAKVGILWNGLTTGITQIVTFLIGILLARLLRPEDFGMVAGVIIFTEVAHSISASGIVTALIQRADIREEHYSTAFTMQMALAVLSYLVLLTISPSVGLFFGGAISGEVLSVMGISVLILPFVSIPTAMLRKKMDFLALGSTKIVQQLSTGITSVVLAFMGWGVWSLVFGRIVGYAVNAVHLANLIKWRPRFGFRRDAGQDLFSFSTKVVAANILNDIASNLDYFIVGRLLGPTQLGFYYRSYYLMSLPTTRICEAMNTVFFSVFSQVHQDDSRLKQAVLKAVCSVSLITFPILTCLFWIAPSFVQVLYGEKWMPSVVPLQIMCFAGMLLSIEPVAVSGIISKGYVGLEVRRQLIYVIVLIAGVLIGSYWGIVGVSAAVLLVSITILILLQRLLKRLIGIAWYELAAVMRTAIIACGIMSIGLFSYQQILKHVLLIDSWPMLVTSVVIGFGCYIVSLPLVGDRTENEIVQKMLRPYYDYILDRPLLKRALFFRSRSV